MRNTLFAAAAAFALIVGTVPTFAAEAAKEAQPPPAPTQSGESKSAASADCTAVMADQSKHTAAEVAACQKK
jgi:hypothetical protein